MTSREEYERCRAAVVVAMRLKDDGNLYETLRSAGKLQDFPAFWDYAVNAGMAFIDVEKSADRYDIQYTWIDAIRMYAYKLQQRAKEGKLVANLHALAWQCIAEKIRCES